ncbi:MAG: 2-C-methyl-D-erythritol 4-phosphate cytidylyltransferase [Methanobrevibacter sp.]|uniref:IspD/TarI family cytidylyltransferase n=1 Tax=Methanobrevibacter sp. TaxID=66852 RepID=UPI0026DFA0A2|nr:2-C-methyl-D-erythritol 4-phosphate cytidylyltransferase [Methanobrevibacter sp.]MDO5849528.1 2-C-methyl-D-erythritol 4-phosphate cytidylyltransferase [Methanobrevibacter sp.]
MIFATILAGGSGSRMGVTEKPKQFLTLGEKPILIHTIEKFALNDKFDEIIVLTPKEWISHTKDLINRYIPDEKITVIESGNLRIDTVKNAMDYIKENHDSPDNIIVTHDAVRPFVTHRIIEENIQATMEHGACNTIVPATDTIVRSVEGDFVDEIPNRAELYQGQTPQSFKLERLEELYAKLDENQRETLTDACKIFTLNNEPVAIVEGEVSNIKITYPYDLKVANFILKE